MFGLGGSTVIPGYEQLPQIAELLARQGLSAQGVAGIMGANYIRVLKHALERG
jgi:microsomal dipeptidase-like Zn-dependent dipeptidase